VSTSNCQYITKCQRCDDNNRCWRKGDDKSSHLAEKKNTCTCVRLLIQSVHEFGERVSFSQGSARDDQTIPKAPRQPSMRPHCIIEWVTDGPPKLARRAPRCGGARLCSAPGRPVAGPGDSRAARLGLGDRSGASPRTPRRGECRQKKSASAGRDEGSRMDGRATAST